MKIICVFALFVFLSGCNDNTEPIYDPTSEIRGIVVAGENGEYLDSVLVGFKEINIPDSLVFFQDSIAVDALHSTFVAPYIYTIKGRFQFGFSFAAEPPVEYEQMFAYKPGRKIWRYNPLLDTVHHLISNIDSIKIKLLIK